MDLTDEQWEAVRPFIPEPEVEVRRPKVGGRIAILEMCSTTCFGFCGPVPRGPIFQVGTRPTRPATGGFRAG